jgi:hypothetical protein
MTIIENMATIIEYIYPDIKNVKSIHKNRMMKKLGESGERIRHILSFKSHFFS